MKRFFKIITIAFLLSLFLGAAFLIYFLNYLKKEKVVEIKSNQESSFSVEIREEEKSFLKKVAGKIKDIIYREATEHNPEGDVLPDEIDDRIKEEIKSRIK